MTGIRILATLFLTSLTAAHGQPAPAFEVASVKVSQLATKGGEGSTRETVDHAPGSLSMRNVTLRSSIRWAYGVKDFEVAGPGWLETERYDIMAKASQPVPDSQLRLMLRALLAERFQLTLHRETRDVPVYALLVGRKGRKLEASKTEGPASVRPNGGALEFRNITMSDLADRLPARPFGIDRPVIDRTDLAGAFDFTMKLADNDAELKKNLERREADHDPSMFNAPLQDLGLRLEPRKGPVEILVVDHARKVPVEN